MSPIFIFLIGLALGLGLPVVSWLIRGDLDSFLIGAVGGSFIIMLAYEMWMEAIRRTRTFDRLNTPPPGPHWSANRPPAVVNRYVDPPTIPEVEPDSAPAQDEAEPSPLAAEVEQAETEDAPVIDLDKKRAAS
jgi:hypothetical protein